MTEYDLVIIGGGAGAFAAAIRADELHATTALINTGLPLGGTCVNVGCVPSKRLLWAGEVLHLAKHHGLSGIDLAVNQFDFQRVVQDELALVERMRRDKYEHALQSLPRVTHIDGRAVFTSPQEVTVAGQQIRAKRFIIATGSTATVAPIEGLRDVGYVTHIEALRLQRQPKELLIIGAGPLGLEFAQLFARFGSAVTVLQRASSILPRAEAALTFRLAKILTAEGITLKTGVTIERARSDRGKKLLRYRFGDRQEEAAGDEILLAGGKTPNTAALGLDRAQVDIDDRQAIRVDPSFSTSQPHIYAVGDATNLPLRLETTAGREGTLAAGNALRGEHQRIDYDAVPYVVFTDPQLGSVGWTEGEEMRRLGVCSCRTVSFADIPKALILQRTEGMIKMVTHPQTKQIIGVHILAPQAGELIAEAMILVKHKTTIDEVVQSLPMFPTLSEAIKIVALSFTKDISKLSCCI
jgi:mercuric reductase